MADNRKLWGRPYWYSIHKSASQYENDQGSAFKSYVNSMAFILPCATCRMNFQRILRQNPIDPYLKSREHLFAWTYMVHDLVNKELGIRSPPYDQVKAQYFGVSKQCSNGSCSLPQRRNPIGRR